MTMTVTIWWPSSGVRIYHIVTGVTSDVGVPGAVDSFSFFHISCGNTCQIWTWHSIGKQCFDLAEKLGKQRYRGKWFDNIGFLCLRKARVHVAVFPIILWWSLPTSTPHAGGSRAHGWSLWLLRRICHQGECHLNQLTELFRRTYVHDITWCWNQCIFQENLADTCCHQVISSHYSTHQDVLS